VHVTCWHCHKLIKDEFPRWRHADSHARYCDPAVPGTVAEPWARR
jgi:hypothetical protein